VAYETEFTREADEHFKRFTARERSHLRVYYEVSDDPGIVTVRAFGVKEGNRVRIGDQWWEPGLQQPEKSHEDAGDEGSDG
jgi:hypothetical protein